MWDTSCLDWKDRIREGRSLLPDLPLNRAMSDDAVYIFDHLRLPDVPGMPLLKDAAGEWFRDAVRALFGSYDPSTRQRMIRELFILVPKKNSKTTYSAALMLVAMFMSQRPRAEFLLVAPTQEVAELAFSQAVGMIEADEVLAKKCHIQGHIKKISYRKTGAYLKIKSFDPRVVTGTKAAGVLMDETHVIAEAHDADRVMGQLRGGLTSQPEGFLVQITTQSERPPAGVFLAELRKAREVRDGLLKAPILPMLYEFPEGVDWKDPANWFMVLPNRDRSITVQRLREDYAQAQSAGPEELARWASQHLNIQIGLQLMFDSWAGASFWLQSADERITFDHILEVCEAVAVGIDGGGFDDLLGLTVVGRERATGRWLSWSRAWVHEIGLERRKSEAPRYRDLIAADDLVLVRNEDSHADIREVADYVERVYLAGLLAGIGVDPVCISDTIDEIESRNISKDLIIAIPQGWRMAGFIQTTERRLAAGELVHAQQPIMDWCVGNSKIESRGNAILVTKAVSGRGKIDPVAALFDAVAIMSQNPQVAGSVYDDIGRNEVKAAAEKAVQDAKEPKPEEPKPEPVLAYDDDDDDDWR
jgi:phage terminase large subunit-like protein